MRDSERKRGGDGNYYIALVIDQGLTPHSGAIVEPLALPLSSEVTIGRLKT